MSQLPNNSENWSTLKRVSFLFVLFYTAFFIVIPVPEALVLWVGNSVFGIENLQTNYDNGGGDTTFDYVYHFVQLIVCFLLALVALFAIPKRVNYTTLKYWTFVALRYELAFLMMEYGFAKVFKTQFPFPNLARLTEPYGESSPMGLLWAFMGYSTGYNIFIGMAEILGGFLLFWRRTATFGAVLTFSVMLNVALLNMFYDVAVKIFSIQLVFFSLVLLAPNFKRMFDFFFMRRESSLVEIPLPTFPKWMNLTRQIGKHALIALLMIYNILHYYEEMTQTNENASRPPLYGVYKTELFVLNNDTLSLSDSTRWNELIIDKLRGRIRCNGDKRLPVTLKVDTLKRQLKITRSTDNWTDIFMYTDSPECLCLKGKLKNDSVSIRFQKIAVDNFLLVNRGFHWINEFPLNR